MILLLLRVIGPGGLLESGVVELLASDSSTFDFLRLSELRAALSDDWTASPLLEGGMSCARPDESSPERLAPN